MQLTNIQFSVVERILHNYNPNEKTQVDLKSPTGSGKTLIATYLISSLMERYSEDIFVFVIATLSSSSLPYFFEQKINLYKKDLPFNKFEVNYVESPSSTKENKLEGTPKLIPKENSVYIFGKSTFGKGRIFTERNVLEDFLQSIEDKNYKLVYIRDEAHIGGKISLDKEAKHFESLMHDSANFIVNMTATPDYNSNSIKIIVKESELNDIRLNDNKWLLKTQLTPLLNKDISDDDLLVDAIKNFKKIKDEYFKLEKNNIIIRPAMLLQVDNEPTKPDLKTQYLESLNKIKMVLTKNGLSWAQYFGDNDKDSNRVYADKFNLDDITKNDNDIDVVIFKIGPSTGWDIPRACTLLQLRNVSSSTLNTQTIGRIKRNPFPGLAKNDITDKYYVYSNAPKIDDNVVIYSYDVKENLLYDDLAVIKIINKKSFTKKESVEKTKQDLIGFLENNKNIIIQNIKKFFVENNNGEDVYRKERITANNHSVFSEVKNVFRLLKEIELLKEKNSNIFETYGIIFEDFYKNNLATYLLYRDVSLSIEHLYLILIKIYLKDLNAIVKNNSQFTPEYKVELLRYEPRQYMQISDADVLESDTTKFKNYLFNIKRNNNVSMMQPLDSQPEMTVFNNLKLEIYKLDKLVKVWAKNINTSNIYGEYLDEDQNFRQSYFDFIIKFSNGTFLYLEVKSEQDIDPHKTKLLEQAYKDYFMRRKVSLFDYPMIICVIRVSGNRIEQTPFYDKDLIKVELETLSFEELLSEVSKIS